MPFTNYPNGVTSFGVPSPNTGNYFSAFGDVPYFVNTVTGSDGFPGTSPDTPFLTVGKAVSVVGNYGTIVIHGNVQETGVVLPSTVSFVTIVGAGPSSPRNVRWKSASTTTSCLEIQGSSCRVINIWFEAPTAASAIKLTRVSGGANSQNAQIVNCEFNTGLSGIESNGGSSGVRVLGCVFHDITAAGSPGAIVSTSSAVADPLRWIIQGNVFINNANHIIMPANDFIVKDNVFSSVGNSITTTSKLVLSGAAGHNQVVNNHFAGTYSIAGGYAPGTADFWNGNYINGGITTANPA